jgi:hypothetical protein
MHSSNILDLFIPTFPIKLSPMILQQTLQQCLLIPVKESIKMHDKKVNPFSRSRHWTVISFYPNEAVLFVGM